MRNKPLPVYNGGVCNIYSIDEEGVHTLKLSGIRFEEKMLGFKRFFAAAADQTKIDRVIRIPNIIGIVAQDIVEIVEVGKFRVELSQKILDFTPPCFDLSLSQLEMFV